MKHVTILLIILLCSAFNPPDKAVVNVLREQILKEAAWAKQQAPATVTAATCTRSAGSKHDFYSEGDYWWPNPAHPDSPYIQRDGMTNPDNFVAHRHAMIRFSRIIGALASAYRITGNTNYVREALPHLKAWFTDTATLMHPNLQYAQAIKGRFTGRGIGIIDAIHLMEVAQGVMVMQKDRAFDRELAKGIRTWFADYLHWLTTHQYGKDEMNAKNNHGTCWVMQTACFARLINDTALLRFCRDRYKQVLLPNQMAADGSFPLELARTKPYGYSLFNLDAMVTICQILSDKENDLWAYQLPDGRSIKKGIAFLYPYIVDKGKWPYKKDVMYWDEWPVAHPSLVFGAAAYQQQEWFGTWKRLDHQPSNAEVVRNLPVRHPLIWL
ncbi:alginate lyase family protein [Chitinophaga filiformis]|uniref:alginate lyase family protein n=1 Tax=Chitinophaga filiformis TaxID=104663 RepID=UPI001F4177E7|nr:alginate lyase family protein [Chitinophaga filiformis]MCF6401284.1 alginate lyase family protein [Chitinophaga filiformis]